METDCRNRLLTDTLKVKKGNFACDLGWFGEMSAIPFAVATREMVDFIVLSGLILHLGC